MALNFELQSVSVDEFGPDGRQAGTYGREIVLLTTGSNLKRKFRIIDPCESLRRCCDKNNEVPAHPAEITRHSSLIV